VAGPHPHLRSLGTSALPRQVVYGWSAKAYGRELRKVYRDSAREKGQIPQPKDKWVEKPMPQCRIVSPQLTDRVEERWPGRTREPSEPLEACNKTCRPDGLQRESEAHRRPVTRYRSERYS
jgi:hypothetical protein